MDRVIVLSRLIACFGLACALSGCPEDEKTPPVAPTPEGFVGPEGGTVTSNDGALTLDIPEGALADGVVITATREDDPESVTGFTYILEPDGLEFDEPVAITMLAPSSLEVDPNAIEGISLLSLSEEHGLEWLENNVTQMDQETGQLQITASLTHFSTLSASGRFGGIRIVGAARDGSVRVVDEPFNINTESFAGTLEEGTSVTFKALQHTVITDNGVLEAQPAEDLDDDPKDLGSNSVAPNPSMGFVCKDAGTGAYALQVQFNFSTPSGEFGSHTVALIGTIECKSADAPNIPCSNDASEDIRLNDTPADATPITTNPFKQDFKAPGGDVDHFVGDLCTGGRLSVKVTSTLAMDVSVSIEEDGESTALTVDNPEEGELAVATAQGLARGMSRYRIRVGNKLDDPVVCGPYELDVQIEGCGRTDETDVSEPNNVPEQATVIPYDERPPNNRYFPISTTLRASMRPGDVDIYSVEICPEGQATVTFEDVEGETAMPLGFLGVEITGMPETLDVSGRLGLTKTITNSSDTTPSTALIRVSGEQEIESLVPYNVNIALLCPQDAKENASDTLDRNAPRTQSATQEERTEVLTAQRDDQDWFSIQLCPGGDLTMFVISRDEANPDATVAAKIFSDGNREETLIAEDVATFDDSFFFTATNEQREVETFDVLVEAGNKEGPVPVFYAFSVDIECPDEDDLDFNNNTSDQAINVDSFLDSRGRAAFENFTAVGQEEDFFDIGVCSEGLLLVNVQADATEDALIVTLLNEQEQQLAREEGQQGVIFTHRFGVLGSGERRFVKIGREFTEPNPIPYNVTFALICPDDSEQNDALETPREIADEEARRIPGGATLERRNVQADDPDFYTVNVCPRGALNITLTSAALDALVDDDLGGLPATPLAVLLDGAVVSDTDFSTRLVNARNSEQAYTVRVTSPFEALPAGYEYDLSVTVDCDIDLDRFDPQNDTFAGAVEVDTEGLILNGQVQVGELFLSVPDVDYFKVPVCQGANIDFVVNLTEGETLSAALFVDEGMQVGGADIEDPVEPLTFSFPAVDLSDGAFVVVRFDNAADPDALTAYGFTVSSDDTSCIVDGDAFEENNAPDEASELTFEEGRDTLVVDELNVEPEDPDYYAVEVCPGGRLTATVEDIDFDDRFDSDNPSEIDDLLLELLDGETVVATGESDEDAFTITATAFSNNRNPTPFTIGLTDLREEPDNAASYALRLVVDCSDPQFEDCTDGVDNTGNGLSDCNDPRCASDPDCDKSDQNNGTAEEAINVDRFLDDRGRAVFDNFAAVDLEEDFFDIGVCSEGLLVVSVQANATEDALIVTLLNEQEQQIAREEGQQGVTFTHRFGVLDPGARRFVKIGREFTEPNPIPYSVTFDLICADISEQNDALLTPRRLDTARTRQTLGETLVNHNVQTDDLDYYAVSVCPGGTIRAGLSGEDLVSARARIDGGEVLTGFVLSLEGDNELLDDDFSEVSALVSQSEAQDIFVVVRPPFEGENFIYDLNVRVECPPPVDRFDPQNNTPTGAVALNNAQLARNGSTTVSGVAVGGDGADHFKAQPVCPDSTSTVTATHTGDGLSLVIFDGDLNPVDSVEVLDPLVTLVVDVSEFELGDTAQMFLRFIDGGDPNIAAFYEFTYSSDDTSCLIDSGDDALEDNDDPEDASELTFEEGQDTLVVDELNVHPEDPDYYAVQVCPGGQITVTASGIDFGEDDYDEEALLLTLTIGETLLASGVVDNPGTDISATATVDRQSETTVTIDLTDARDPNDVNEVILYTLTVQVECPDPNDDPDRFEENDEPEAALVLDPVLVEGGVTFDDLNVYFEDPDFYSIAVCSGGRLSAGLEDVSPNIDETMTIRILRGEDELASNEVAVEARNTSSATENLIVEVTTTLSTLVDYKLALDVDCPQNDDLEPNDNPIDATPVDDDTDFTDLLVHSGDVDMFTGPDCFDGSLTVTFVPRPTSTAAVRIRTFLDDELKNDTTTIDLADAYVLDFERVFESDPNEVWRVEISTSDFSALYRLDLDYDCPEPPETDCTDGNDNDGNGQTDCNDGACEGDPACPEICTDGVDNDISGLTDCDDPFCRFFFCEEFECGDGRDNDDDGAIDCDDPDCADAEACEEDCVDPADNNENGIDDCSELECGGTPRCLQAACENAPVISGNSFQTYGQLAGQINNFEENSGDGCFGGSGGAGPEQVFLFQPSQSGSVCIHTFGSAYSTVLYVRPDCQSPSAELVCNDNTRGGQSMVELPVNAGQNYFIFLDAFERFEQGDYALTIINGPCLINDYEPDCARGNDNNNNDLIGCADPLCTGSPACVETACSDGEDNDQDNAIDCADPDCVGSPDCGEAGFCLDRLDNDEDGAVDCDDSECSDDPGCVPGVCANPFQLGVGSFEGEPFLQGSVFTAACAPESATSPEVAYEFTAPNADTYCIESDVLENGALYRLDGSTGCLQNEEPIECFTEGRHFQIDLSEDEVMKFYLESFADPPPNSYFGSISRGTCPVDEVCDDEEDNDQDGDTDCEDDDCLEDPHCDESTQCDDGIDNDLDGDTDCDDDECFGPACAEVCGDGLDNDGDGDIDCDDADCSEEVDCQLAVQAFVGQPGETVVVEGALNGDDPIYGRTGFGCVVLPTNNHKYEAIDLVNDTGADQVIDINALWVGGNGFLALYTSFDPDNPGAGCITDNENAGGDATRSEILDVAIAAGQTLTLVATTSPAGVSIPAFTISVFTEAAPETQCADNEDNDVNGLTDCQELFCAVQTDCTGAAIEVPASGQSVQFNGALAQGDAQWARPQDNCFPGDQGQFVDVKTLTNTSNETRVVSITATWTFNGYIHAFGPPFDLATLDGCLFGNNVFGNQDTSQIQVTLAPGESVAVTLSSFQIGVTGDYSVDVTTLP